jgi:glycosyltransferase 2 family protein
MGKIIKFLFLLLGIVLLAVITLQTDLSQLAQHISSIGFSGVALILFVYSLYFGADVLSWQITMLKIPFNMVWFGRLYVVRMIGEAYNNLTPSASLGGEPIKAWLLKSNWAIPVRDSASSLVIAKTASMFSLSVFGCVGVLLLFQNSAFSESEKHLALGGLVFIVFSSIVFFMMQYFSFSSFVVSKVSINRFSRLLQKAFSTVKDIDNRFDVFYRQQGLRFSGACLAAMANWLLGVVEIFLILHLIGYPLTLAEVFIIESLVQLVRTITFFIPAGLGAQEGTFFIVVGVLTGVSSAGLAVALIRRFRELVWLAASFLLAVVYSVKPGTISKSELEGL